VWRCDRSGDQQGAMHDRAKLGRGTQGVRSSFRENLQHSSAAGTRRATRPLVLVELWRSLGYLPTLTIVTGTGNLRVTL